MSRSKKVLLVSTILGGLAAQACAQGNPPSGPITRSVTVGKGSTPYAGNGGTTPYNIMNTSTSSEWVQCAAAGSILLANTCIQAHTPPLPNPLGNLAPGEFPLVVSLYSDQPLPNNPVAGYFDTWAAAGSAQAWAINPIVQLAPGSSGGFAGEFDLNNWDCDPGPIGTPNQSCLKAFDAIFINAASPYPMGSAVAISAVVNGGTNGGVWRQGVSAVGNVIINNMIIDDTASQVSYELEGPHLIGFDTSAATFSQTAYRLAANQGFTWVNTSNPVQAVLGVTWSSGVATVQTASPHGLANAVNVTIAGVTPTGYNGTYSITVVDATHFSYPLATNPGTETVPTTMDTTLVWSSANGGTVTVTSAAATTYTTGNYINISGATPTGYNGNFYVTVIDSTHFTYPLIVNPGADTAAGVSSQNDTFQVASLGNPTVYADNSGVVHLNGTRVYTDAPVVAIASINGMTTGFSGSGGTMAWNHDGLGETDFIGGPGLGTGGFKFFAETVAGALSSQLLYIQSNGSLQVAGAVVAPSYFVGATAGVSCSGTPTSSFAVVNGIVTHC